MAGSSPFSSAEETGAHPGLSMAWTEQWGRVGLGLAGLGGPVGLKNMDSALQIPVDHLGCIFPVLGCFREVETAQCDPGGGAVGPGL